MGVNDLWVQEETKAQVPFETNPAPEGKELPTEAPDFDEQDLLQQLNANIQQVSELQAKMSFMVHEIKEVVQRSR